MYKLLIAFMLVFWGAGPALATSQSGTLTFNFDLSAQPEGEEVQLWIPYPVSDARQLVSDVRYGGDFAAAGIYTDRVHSTPMLHARWEKGARSRVLTFSFHVEREEVEMRDLSGPEAPWSPADHTLNLQATSLGPVDGEVRKLADRIVQGKEGVKAKARAIYDWIVKNMYRDPQTRGCGVGDVCALIERPGGKCADIHSVFVSLARAAGVPAREIFGIRQGKEPVTDVTTWQHCWAEFYLPGTGWVPVDPGDVRKMMLKENLDLDDPRTREYRRYFWGGLDPYRVKLAEGRDLTLNPPQQAGPVNYLMYPYAEVGGKPLDWLDPASFKYTITWRE